MTINIIVQKEGKIPATCKYVFILLATRFIFFPGSFTQIQPASQLYIGSKIPDIALTMTGYKTPQAKLSDFKANLLILDFWATWCSPCVQSFPKMDTLQQVFQGELFVLPVTRQNFETVDRLFSNMNRLKKQKLYSVINDTTLNHAFYPKFLPHYVWINRDGIVQAITGMEQVTEDNIRKILADPTATLEEKTDGNVNIDAYSPVFLTSPQVPITEPDILYRVNTSEREAVIVKYRPGIGSFDYSNPEKTRNVSTNLPVVSLFKVAFGEGRDEYTYSDALIRLHIKDSARFMYRNEQSWLQNNSYSYEQSVSQSDSANLYKYMQQDLEKAFPLRAKMIKENKEALMLVKTSSDDRLQTKGGKEQQLSDGFMISFRNAPYGSFWYELFLAYQDSPLPLVDKTGFSREKRIDMDINGVKVGDADKLNKALESYGLRLVKKTIETDVLVISEETK